MNNTKIVKFHDVGYTLGRALNISRFPCHKNLNRFAGVVWIRNSNEAGLVFEKIDGVSLNDYPIHQCSSDQRWKMAIDIAKVYVHFEENGYPYNDVKSDNVMISKSGEAIVIDYNDCFDRQISKGENNTQISKFGFILKSLFKDTPKFQAVKSLAEECHQGKLNWAEVLAKLEIIEQSRHTCTIL